MKLTEAVTKSLAMLAAIYGQKFPVNAVTVEAWTTLLADVRPQELVDAIAAWCKSEAWPPTPAEIRAKCPSLCRCGSCTACSQRRRAIDASQDDDRAIRFAEAARIARSTGRWATMHPAERANLEAWEKRAALVLEARKAAPALESPRTGLASISDLARSVPQRRAK